MSRPRGRMRAWGLAALALSSIAIGFAGCSSASPGATCDCASSQITIDVPADIASSVTVADIHLSGPACTGVTPDCANQTNGCTAYDFSPNAAGECDVEIDKPSGTFTATVTFTSQTGCCAGDLTPTTTTIDVPEPEDGG